MEAWRCVSRGCVSDEVTTCDARKCVMGVVIERHHAEGDLHLHARLRGWDERLRTKFMSGWTTAILSTPTWIPPLPSTGGQNHLHRQLLKFCESAFLALVEARRAPSVSSSVGVKFIADRQSPSPNHGNAPNPVCQGWRLPEDDGG